MKLSILLWAATLSLGLSQVQAAQGLEQTRDSVCRQGLDEQKPFLNAKIILSATEEGDVIKQCMDSTSVYWFSQAMYIQARNAGDGHADALSEYRLFNSKPDLPFTIPDYIYFRVVLHNLNLPYLLRAQAFRDVLDTRKKYSSYPY